MTNYVMTVADGVQRLLKPAEEKNVLNTFDNLENFETFQKIQKQKKLEIKHNNWKDLHSNPKKKVKKFLYYSLLIFSMLFWFATIITCFIPSYCLKINQLVLLTPAIIFTTITLVLNIVIYKSRIILHVVIPYLISLVIFICFTLLNSLMPLTITGKTRNDLGQYNYYSGLYYVEFYNDIQILNYKSEEDLKKYGYIYEKDGLVYFELPKTINSKKVKYLTYEAIPDCVEVLIVPEHVIDLQPIYYKKTSNLKTIKTTLITGITIYDVDNTIIAGTGDMYNDSINANLHFNFEFEVESIYVEVKYTNYDGSAGSKGWIF